MTTERAGRYSAHIDNHCYYCGAIETDQHLFFKCNLPTNIWSVASPPIITNNIPVEEDGVQMSLPFLFTHNNITDEILCKIFSFSGIFGKREMITGSKGEHGHLSRSNKQQMPI